MHEVMRLAHKFLQSFCFGNQANQAILHQSLDLFLTPGVCIFCVSMVYNCEVRFHDILNLINFVILIPGKVLSL